MTQTEKAKQIGMQPSHYSRTLKRLKSKSFLTANDKKVAESEEIIIPVLHKDMTRNEAVEIYNALVDFIGSNVWNF